MGSLLLKNAKYVVTLDSQDRVLENCDVLIENGVIRYLGNDKTNIAEEIIDAAHKIVYPGLINTHHHLYQTLTRNIPAVQQEELFGWLTSLYEIWRELTPEAVYYSALAGLGQLLKSGCTTAADHFYVFPRGQSKHLLDEEIRAAQEIGIRFYATRGSMSLGRSQGGLPPDDVVQTEQEILDDCQRLIDRYHEKEKFSMVAVGLAPCSPFSVTADLLKESAVLAREKGVRLHTHLAETRDEERFCLEKFGMRPLAYLESMDWVGPDVWFAHGIHFNEDEIGLLAATGTGVAHCPVSNQKLASGTAPIPQMLKAGVKVGLAVDGSASNDGSDLLAEMRAALLIHKAAWGIKSLAAGDVWKMATAGSAQLLGKNELGTIEIGKAADLFMIDTRQLEFAGGLHDPLALPLVCSAAGKVDTTIVNGKIVVQNGRLLTIDQERVADQVNRLAQTMLQQAGRRIGIKYL